jgi:hypothetical protein
MRNSRRCLLAFVWSMGVSVAAASAATPGASDSGGVPLAGAAHQAMLWVVRHGDHRGRPFVIVDKRQAHIHVFEPSGARVGATPVLIGLTAGDRDAVPNFGDRSVASLTANERTTPAGRFDSEPGRNDKGEAIVWFDYDAALAIHRLRPAPAHERRPQRMASTDATERRITYGCVVVPVAFYLDVIAPTLGRQRGVVYVLPEQGTLEAMLRGAEVALRTP